jgi:hypothetical protein
MKKTMRYLLSGAFLSAALVLGSCDGDDDDSLPQIDGYNNSDEVAASNLLAHWTFDDTNSERLSGTAPSNTFGTVGFADGQIGRALDLNQGVLVYPSITAINGANSLNNFTVSLWVNVTGNKKTAKEGFTAFFGLIPTSASDIWGDVMALAETARHLPTSDTLELKNILNTHPAAGGNSLQDNVALKNGDVGKYFMGARRWAHYVMTWNATTHQFRIYGDAESVGGYNDRGTTAELIMAVPVKAVFGSLASNDIGFASAPDQQGWNPWATAKIDDVRVFNTVLSDAEITALFNLGSAGR